MVLQIHRIEPTFVFDRNKLSTLNDYYYDTRCPGDNFISVTKEECKDVIKIMYDVVLLVNEWRVLHCYSISEFVDKTNLVGKSDTKDLGEVNAFE